MTTLAILAVLTFTKVPDSVADRVVLRDGSVVLGQILPASKRERLVLVVRRAWADKELPERAQRWRDAEAPWMKRARDERLRRLETWSDQRRRALRPEQARSDAILHDLDVEITHLQKLQPGEDLPPLMMAALKSQEVRSVDRRPPELGRLLRLGWKADFPDVEAMPPADLRTALQGRHFDVAGNDLVPIDDLLPIPIESEARWLSRRAATEVTREPGLRFVRFQNLVLPEDAAGLPANPDQALSDLLGPLLGERPAEDPLAARLRQVEAKGCVGAVLTRLDFTPNLDGTRVNVVLLVRLGPENWRPAIQQAATVRLRELDPDAGANIPEDPRLKPLFDLASGLGLPDAANQMRQTGAATQQALSRARDLFQSDMDALVPPIGGGKP